MPNSNKIKSYKTGAKVTTGVKGLQVADSPLNGVKLDLGLFILVGLVLFVLLENINISQGIRFLVLGVWALFMLVWVVLKTKAIIKKTAQQGNTSSHYNVETGSEPGGNSTFSPEIDSDINTHAHATTTIEKGSAGESNGAK